MRRICIYGLIIAAVTAPLSAEAFDWRNLNIFKRQSVQTVTEPTRYTPVTEESTLSQLAALNRQLSATDTKVQNSFISVVSALAPQQESTDIRAKMASILANSMISETDRSNQIASLMNTYATSITDNKSYITSTIANMNEIQKANLIKNIASLAGSGTQYASIASQYANIASAISKAPGSLSTIANNITTIKNNAIAVRNTAKAIQSLVTQISSLSNAAGLGALFFGN